MPFQADAALARDAGKTFGDYLTTFKSRAGQVRADLFRSSKLVKAYVSFPTGLDAGRVTDPYVSELWAYAREQGFADRFRVVLT
jgi:hypothetical protein